MEVTFTLADFRALAPLLILLSGGLSILLIDCFKKSEELSFVLGLATFVFAFLFSLEIPADVNALLSPWIRFDALGRFFSIFFIIVGIITLLLSYPLLNRFDAPSAEYYFLVISSVAGLILIGQAADFLTLFIGLETLSLSLYILTGYMKKWNISHEAAMKYFLLGSLGAAFLIYGIAFIYGATGTTAIKHLAIANEFLFLLGLAFLTVGLCFKAAVVPFHTWAPDVYDGAPTAVTAFMSVGTKAGAFAGLVLVFLMGLAPIWHESIAWLAYPTLIYANYAALTQTQLRRFFAYSGISHAGFLLIPLAAATPESVNSLLFYLVVYGIATLGSFAILALLDNKEEGATLEDLKGLFYKSPFYATVLTLCLLTLGGIPPTAGFFAKFYIFKVAYQTGYYGLIIVGLLTSVLSAYYYLRIVAHLFAKPEEYDSLKSSWSLALVGVLSLAALISVTIFPDWWIQRIP